MNAIILAIPIILIRYLLLGSISKEAFARAAFFPPTEGKERVAYYVYIVTTLALFISLFFARVTLDSVVSAVGLLLYIAGVLLYARAVVDFSKPQANGLNKSGLYRYSRNPMYVAFFLYLLGVGLLIQSWLYIIVLLVFQVSVHYLILSEERWCIANFGEDYRGYMKAVRRYF